MRLLKRRVLAVLTLMACGSTLCAEPATKSVTVFAAASLTNVLEELGANFTQATGVYVRLSFAASSVLARQIEAGARADVFLSADQEWMDYLDQRGRIAKSSRRNLLGNRLALIAPVDSDIQLKIAPGFPLASALGKGRLVTGDPDTVPVGRYARSALTSLGVWHEVSDRLVRAQDVRHALMFVARAEAPLGIVYETDARADSRVRLVGLFPDSSHQPITCPVALTPGASPDAARFLEFIGSDAARVTFERAGFAVLQ
jgi:molybdate transport system substrate-binding protein